MSPDVNVGPRSPAVNTGYLSSEVNVGPVANVTNPCRPSNVVSNQHLNFQAINTQQFASFPMGSVFSNCAVNGAVHFHFNK